MKRIVIIHNRLVIGGPAVAIAETIRQLGDRFEFYLVAGAPLADEMDASWLFKDIRGLHIIHLPSMKRSPSVFRDIRTLLALKKLFRRIQPHAVHTHGAKPGLLGRLAAHSAGIPVILHTYHGHIFHSYFNRFISGMIVRVERWLARRSTGIIVISSKLFHEISAVYKVAPPQKLHTIPLGLPLAGFAENAAAKRAAFRQRCLLEDHETAVGIVGRITAVKNMLLFLKVAEAMKAETQIRFFVVGDGDEKEKLQQWLRRRQIGFTSVSANPVKATVTFTSWQKGAGEVMNGLDIVCLTSLNEGTPVSLIEAAAAGKPVITTAAGSVDEIVEHEVTGFIVHHNPVEAFCRYIRLLAGSRQQAAAMGLKGRERVNALYSPAPAAAKTALLYNGEEKA